MRALQICNFKPLLKWNFPGNHKVTIVTEEFSHIKSLFFNTAQKGPSPLSSKTYLDKAMAIELDPTGYHYTEWGTYNEEVRSEIATFLGCDINHIAHHASTSEAISNISLGFPFEKGDKVVVFNGDYPSNVLPWKLNEGHNNYSLHILDEQSFYNTEVLKAILPKATRVIDISHVLFNSGRKLDIDGIADICQQLNIFLIVDATQSLGCMTIPESTLKKIDVLACSTYKWLLGSYGHSFAYYSNRAIDIIRRTHIAMQTTKIKDSRSLLNYSLDPIDGARKFDRGESANMICLSLLQGSLKLFNKIGPLKIEEHNKSLMNHFYDNINSSEYDIVTSQEFASGIVCLKPKLKDPLELEKKLNEKNIDLSVREGNLRFSFHLYNTKEQINTLLELL